MIPDLENIFDMHVHTSHSPDGDSGMEVFAQLVDKGILKGCGFADHVDFMPECGAYGYFDSRRFTSELNCYKERGYSFFAGAEIDFAEDVLDDISGHLKKNCYDYTISSVHMINGISISNDRDIFDFARHREKLKHIIDLYYREVCVSVECGLFQVAGHIGVYKRYLGNKFFEEMQLYETVLEKEAYLARLCAETGIIVEVNTSGLYSALSDLIPDAGFLALYKKAGGNRLCLGSDAHNASNVGRGFEEAVKRLEKAGFTKLMNPWGTKL